MERRRSFDEALCALARARVGGGGLGARGKGGWRRAGGITGELGRARGGRREGERRRAGVEEGRQPEEAQESGAADALDWALHFRLWE